MNILFYVLALPSGLIALVFLFKTLTGTAAGSSTLSEKIVTVLASLLVLGALYYAFELAIKQSKLGLGIGVILVSWVVFIVMMLVSGLMNTKLWN